MVKNSFSLLETIIAVTVISILVGGFLRSSSYSFTKNSNLLNIKNDFLTNILTNLETTTFDYNYQIKEKTNIFITDSGSRTKLQYNKDNIYLEKYVLDTISIETNNIEFKDFQ
mgnify:CR=1 FL=1